MGHIPVAQKEADIEAEVMSSLDDEIQGEIRPRLRWSPLWDMSIMVRLHCWIIFAGQGWPPARQGITQHIGAYHVDTEKG